MWSGSPDRVVLSARLRSRMARSRVPPLLVLLVTVTVTLSATEAKPPVQRAVAGQYQQGCSVRGSDVRGYVIDRGSSHFIMSDGTLFGCILLPVQNK